MFIFTLKKPHFSSKFKVQFPFPFFFLLFLFNRFWKPWIRLIWLWSRNLFGMIWTPRLWLLMSSLGSYIMLQENGKMASEIHYNSYYCDFYTSSPNLMFSSCVASQLLLIVSQSDMLGKNSPQNFGRTYMFKLPRINIRIQISKISISYHRSIETMLIFFFLCKEKPYYFCVHKQHAKRLHSVTCYFFFIFRFLIFINQ